MRKKIIILKIIVLLIIGFFLYYIFFSNAIFVKLIDRVIGTHYLTINIENDRPALQFVRNYLMDILWSCSLSSAIGLIIGSIDKIYASIIILSGFIIIMEIIQIFSFIPGTFDVWDIVVELLSSVITLFVDRKINKEL